MKQIEIFDPYRAIPDVLPVGVRFSVTAIDAGAVWNREAGRCWTSPGEYIQYTLVSGAIEIRIMRIAKEQIGFYVHFGPDLPKNLLHYRLLSLEELKETVQMYLSELFSGGG